MEKADKLARARNLNRPVEPAIQSTGALEKLTRRLAVLEAKQDFIDDEKWQEHYEVAAELPWDDVCVRHGMMSYIAGAKNCPYPEDTYGARRWTAGYSFAAYWRSIITDELKDRVSELESINYEHSGGRENK